MSRIPSRLTYANVMATIAVFFVLSGGTAVALTGSNTGFSDDIVNGEVKADDIGGNAIASGKIVDGGVQSVDILDGAVGSPDILDGAIGNNDVHKSAITSGKVQDESLTGADVNESSFAAVPGATHAANSDRLGGRAASGYQRSVTGTCNGGAIRAINGDGAVDCIDQAVFTISADLTSASGNNFRGASFFASNLSLLMRCNPTSAAADFINNGFGGATLNWIFSQGGTQSTVNASGTSVPGRNELNVITFGFTNRLEGQWIFADGEGVTTVHLHAFISPGDPAFCEFKGTADWAPLG